MSFKLKFNCPAKWEKMADCGDRRFCDTCQESVHDLTQYDEADAIALVHGSESSCVRVKVNKNGQVHTRTGISKTLILSSALGLGCWGDEPVETIQTTETTEETEILMGEPEGHGPQDHQTTTEQTEAHDPDCETSTATTDKDNEPTRISVGKIAPREPEAETPDPANQTH